MCAKRVVEHDLSGTAVVSLYQWRGHAADAYAEIRRSTIALNGSFFHTQRMVLQYLRNAYLGVEP